MVDVEPPVGGTFGGVTPPLVDECVARPREMRVYALSILAGRRKAATRPMSPNAARAIIATA